MSKTAQLLALAEAATPGPWRGYDDIVRFPKPEEGGFRIAACSRPIANAAFIAAANPETIKQLVELVQLMKFHLDIIADEENWDTDGTWNSSSYPDEIAMEAIEAFNKWEEK